MVVGNQNRWHETSQPGSSPSVATSMVIMIGRSRSTAPSTAASTICSRPVSPPLLPGAQLVDVFEHDYTRLHRDAEERKESDRR